MSSPLDAVLTLTVDEKNALIEAIKPRVQQLFERAEDPNWKPYKKKDSYEVFYMKTNETPVITIKSEGVIDASMEQVAEFFSSFVEFTPQIDPTYKDGKSLEIIGDKHTIVYSGFKTPYPLVANRDFLLHTFVTKLENGVGLSLAHSIERPEVPTRASFVRAVLNASGYLYRPAPNDPSKTFVQYILNMDPKGSIPVAVVNATAADQGENIHRAQKHFASKKGKK